MILVQRYMDVATPHPSLILPSSFPHLSLTFPSPRTFFLKMASDSQPVFSPVCPIPFVLQPAERIQQLKDYLPTEIGQVQRVNVEALIRMYESGELGPRQLGDPPVYLVEGKRVEKNPWEDESVPNHSIKWCEVCQPFDNIQTHLHYM